jgi:hypothetical protein
VQQIEVLDVSFDPVVFDDTTAPHDNAQWPPPTYLAYKSAGSAHAVKSVAHAPQKLA